MSGSAGEARHLPSTIFILSALATTCWWSKNSRRYSLSTLDEHLGTNFSTFEDAHQRRRCSSKTLIISRLKASELDLLRCVLGRVRKLYGCLKHRAETEVSPLDQFVKGGAYHAGMLGFDTGESQANSYLRSAKWLRGEPSDVPMM
jgi:hypothetical protein